MATMSKEANVIVSYIAGFVTFAFSSYCFFFEGAPSFVFILPGIIFSYVLIFEGANTKNMAIFALLALTVLIMAVSNIIRKAQDTEGYLTTYGTVARYGQSSSYDRDTGAVTINYKPVISYSVGGGQYTMVSNSSVGQKYAPDKKFKIKYNPSNPESAYISSFSHSDDLNVALLSALFIFFIFICYMDKRNPGKNIKDMFFAYMATGGAGLISYFAIGGMANSYNPLVMLKYTPWALAAFLFLSVFIIVLFANISGKLRIAYVKTTIEGRRR